ncbi:MAG: hypothetical protein JWN11_2306 [Hyphomicrobiales bacterium]|nr:hypothetical protein [Hyphomicrobiales bacterium]
MPGINAKLAVDGSIAVAADFSSRHIYQIPLSNQ